MVHVADSVINIDQAAELPKSWTLVDYQGKLDREYKASYQWSDKPRHKADVEGWPADAKETVERLANAGFVHDRGVIVCTTCGGR